MPMYKHSMADRRHQRWMIYTLMVNTVSHYPFYIQVKPSQWTNKFHIRCSIFAVSKLSVWSVFVLVSEASKLLQRKNSSRKSKWEVKLNTDCDRKKVPEK